MQPEGIDEKLLIKYFPGELSEEEQVQVEDRAFADKHCLDDLEAARIMARRARRSEMIRNACAG